ncbi:CDP-glycerol glycerophosphotransferase family protein [Pseudomonas sp. J452]|uniref:CDP-glycerol glycerophosphotransferase family protein n=1 Tax=Pseudomonas sp. J452 TaxID=2898441 RepID=UPI0021AE100C|nr:CDP-glycerol glycerophosphotransferase family protein [Pseudomonas sp. J452]UUY09349.1 CDP-glycerol glycerophosphotransferase family protein [Pseudomonas sp. J452]
MTRALQVLGVELGNNLMPAAALNNETGFFEDLDINELNIEILKTLGYSWHSLACVDLTDLQNIDLSTLRQKAAALLKEKLQNHSYFGLKDPRICRLLPFWQTVFAELSLDVHYLIASRNPISVAQSLAKRDGFELEKGHLLWQEHMLNSLRLTTDSSRIVVDFDQLLAQPDKQLGRIARQFGLTFDPASVHYQQYRHEFLKDSLRHTLYSIDELEHAGEASSLSRELFRLLSRLADDNATQGIDLNTLHLQQQALSNALQLIDKGESKARSLKAKAEQLNGQLQQKTQQLQDKGQLLQERDRQLQEKMRDIQGKDQQLQGKMRHIQDKDRKLIELGHTINQLKARNQTLIAEVLQYKQSTSWRITAPMRRLVTLGTRLRALSSKLRGLINSAGGPLPLLQKLLSIYRLEGRHGILQRARLYRMSKVSFGANWPGKDFALSSAARQQQAESTNRANPPTLSAPAQAEAQPISQSRLKLAIAVHVFYPELWPEIARRIRNLPFAYDLFITVAAECRAALEEQLVVDPLAAEIVEVPNQGYDILPFITLLPRLQAGQYDLVCKVHSKKGSANLEQLHPELGNLWLDLLLDPLLGSEQVARDAVLAFERDAQLGMLGSADLYKSAARLMYGNEIPVTRLLQQLDPTRDPAHDWGFFAGSMFWARLDTLTPLLTLEPLLSELDNAATLRTGTHASAWHAMERIFGLLPSLTGQRVALSYATDLIRQNHAVHLQEAARPSPYGIGLTLVAESRIQQYQSFLASQPGFDAHYYAANTPQAAELGMLPLTHFLRYGIYSGQCPSANFSPGLYWDEHRDVLLNRQNALVHYIQHGRKEGRSSFPAQNNSELICEQIAKSGLFDAKHYKRSNPDVLAARIDPLQHFCKHGYLELRKPNPDFDLEWYRREHLDAFLTPINPLLHYVNSGSKRRLPTRPKAKATAATGMRYAPGQQPRRICLFAGYDPHGLIDDYVLDYLKALSKHADIYFLSDATMPASELQKLTGLVKGAWAIRHGEYDFGSYSRLARLLVGWDTINSYDELILANDSCYLIDSLDPVFAAMDRRQCDWWGMQATKGLSATRHIKSNGFKQKIPLAEVKRKLLTRFEQDDFYDFHLGAYFLVFRQPVLQEGSLAKLLDGVKKQPNKKAIIQSYEIGLTRTLINRKFEFDTFIDSLHPFHPIYTERHFDLVAEGMPLFKRFFLTENHYHVPELWRWKERLLELRPNLDLAPFEKNLERVAPADKLYKSLHIPHPNAAATEQDALLDAASFLQLDGKVAKHDNWWAFPVCAYDHSLSGNDRAVFEEVRNDPNIKKVILTRSKAIELSGENIEVLPLESRQGQERLLRCKYVFIKHTPRENALYPLRADLHRFINLWHGIPLKRIGYASLDLKNKLVAVADQHSRCHSVISSSKIDRMAMASAFYPLSFHHVWLTGLPRNDFILRETEKLPVDLRTDLERLQAQLAGKRLVLFAPTFRNNQSDGHYPFSQAEQDLLAACLNKHGAVLGIREHMAAKANSYFSALQELPTLQLGNAQFSNIEMLYRQAEILITDYSSCFIDFMLTGKQQICFAYDLQSYAQSERGLFYDLDTVFPGPICEEFSSLLQALDNALSNDTSTLDPDYALKRKIFFDFIDDSNAARVVQHVQAEFMENASA